MDYTDQVLTHIRSLKPGRYPLDHLKERDRFIEAVKYLITGEWLTDVCFTDDYHHLIIPGPIPKPKPTETVTQ